jgi:hypothetical protein
MNRRKVNTAALKTRWTGTNKEEIGDIYPAESAPTIPVSKIL